MSSDAIGKFNPVVIFIKGLVHIITRFFFSDVNIIGEQRIPSFGPVLFFGNHSNQFVDACILLFALPRYPRFLIAETSFKKAVIGTLAKWAGAIGVCRPEDRKYPGTGEIKLLPMESRSCSTASTPARNGDTAEKVKIENINRISKKQIKMIALTPDVGKFTKTLRVKDVILVETDIDKYRFTVLEILNDTTVILECSVIIQLDAISDIPISNYFVCPKIDQSKVYSHVTEVLREGASIGIFPEGGSHDQTELLPLKPGMAIMALEAACKGIEDILLVPVGIFYSSPKDFMSSVTIEVNKPITVTTDLIELYKTDRHEAVNQLLQACQAHLEEVMISAVDDEVLQCVKLATSLYTPDRGVMDNETKHQLTHFFSMFFHKYENNEKVQNILRDIHSYSCLIRNNGIADKDVWYLRLSSEEAFIIFMETAPLFLYSVVLVGCTTIFWGPIRGLASMYATNRAKIALKKSEVKIRAFDVMASYKILFIMVLIPLVNSLYGIMLSLLIYGPNGKQQLIGIVLAVMLFPFLYYISLKEHARLMRRWEIITACLWPLSRRFTTFRQNDGVILGARRGVILSLRSTVKTILNINNDETLKNELSEILPPSLLEADTRRIERQTGSMFDSSLTEFSDYKEEML